MDFRGKRNRVLVLEKLLFDVFNGGTTEVYFASSGIACSGLRAMTTTHAAPYHQLLALA